MISVEARGRLGNHLFQFAFGLAAAIRLSTDFAFNDELLRPIFTLEPWGRPSRRLARSARYRIASRTSPFPVAKVDPDGGAPGAVLGNLRDRTHYAGFFQSADFFAGAEDSVRRAFRLRREHLRAFEMRYGKLTATGYVCCHVRQTDYREWNGGRALPASYYRACLEQLSPGRETRVIAVGDDPEWVRKELGDTRIRVEHNTEAVDLLLLANADQLVLSNSSFAWWGAWLNPRATRVLAPRDWLGFPERREWPRGILVPGWERVAVESPVRS